MKTKEQILAHLNEVPYNKSARNRIVGYLLGAGVVEKGEVVNFVESPCGQKFNDFDVFYRFVTEMTRKEVLLDLVNDLIAEQVLAEESGDEGEVDRKSCQISLLLETFEGLDLKAVVSENGYRIEATFHDDDEE